MYILPPATYANTRYKAFIKWTAIEESSSTYICGLSKLMQNQKLILGLILLSLGMLIKFAINVIRL